MSFIDKHVKKARKFSMQIKYINSIKHWIFNNTLKCKFKKWISMQFGPIGGIFIYITIRLVLILRSNQVDKLAVVLKQLHKLKFYWS